MAFFAGAQLDRGLKCVRINHLACITERDIIHPRPVFRDQPLGLFAGFHEAGFDNQLHHRNAAAHVFCAQRYGRQIIAHAALFKHFARGGFGFGRRLCAMQQGGDFIGQNNLGMVNLGVLKRAKAVTFIER